MRPHRDPFEPGLEPQDRQSRIGLCTLQLHREYGGQQWNEEITVTKLRSYDEETGVIELFGITGRIKLDSRECGQFRVINLSEIEKRAEVIKQAQATQTPRPKSENSFVTHAETILAAAGKPMHVKEVTAAALKAGLTTSGKTPDATMAARLGGIPNRFDKLGKGMFALKS